MSIKKKMGMGIMAGALGMSLIGGGTWAAFNDVHEVNNSFHAGTLDLVVGESTTMDFVIKNLKPGDYFTKELVLENNGSLAINQIKVHANKKPGWENKDIVKLNDKVGAGSGDNTEDEFLSQFNIEIKERDTASTVYTGTLANLVSGIGIGELTGTNDTTEGLGVSGSKTYDVKVTFVEDSVKFNGSRFYQQNKYQGELSNLEFVFEATQMPGVSRDNN